MQFVGLSATLQGCPTLYKSPVKREFEKLRSDRLHAPRLQRVQLRSAAVQTAEQFATRVPGSLSQEVSLFGSTLAGL